MAALGSILRKGTRSVRSTAQYERLNQDPSDNEEEEDDILFVQEGVASKQNGFSPSPKTTETELLTNGKSDDKIELSELGIQKARIRKASEVEVRTLRYRSLTVTRIVCFILTLISAIGFVIGLIVILPRMKIELAQSRHYKQSQEWNITYPEYATESLVQLFDVDEDGRLDIIFSIVPGSDVGKSEPTLDNEEEYCKKKGFTSTPCVAEVKAIRGYDGALMWQFFAHSSIFEMNCGNIDINKDGKMDCVATGRMATVVAFDPRKGEVFWTAEHSQMEETWNCYNVLVIPDTNKDEVLDLVLAHGGDPSFPPEPFVKRSKKVTKRHAGRLLLLDGASGRTIGKRYLSMPDNKETYMSPIMHLRKDGSQYILFGHGGETVPGTLFAISLPDFYRYVMKMNSSETVPWTNGAYGDWGKRAKSDEGILEIYRSQKKGIMTPPVCVDVTGDGVGDILMSAYEGLITLYDGETLDQIWSTPFPNMESYSTPAPGYFNDDDTLDFMLQQNLGAWPKYSWTETVILDGKTGKTIWQLNSTHYDMTSDLVAKTTDDKRDMFIFQVSGREAAERIKKRPRRAAHKPEFLPNHQRRYHPPAEHSRQPQQPADDYQHTNSWQNGLGKYENAYNNQEYNFRPANLPRYYPNGVRTYGQTQNEPFDTENHRDPYSKQAFDSSYGDYVNSDLLYPDNTFDYDHSVFDNLADDNVEYTGITHQHLEPNSDEEMLAEDHEDHVLDDHEEYDDNQNDEGTISCQSNPKDLITEFFIMDRTTASAPFLLYKHTPEKHYYNFTELEREALASSSEDSGNHQSSQRVKRHGGHHAPVVKYNWSNEACALMSLAHRCTGAIGDLDGDGSLDLVFVLDKMSAVKDAKTMDFIRMKTESSLIKINLQDRVSKSTESSNFIPITVMMKDSKKSNNEKTFTEMHFRPYKEQPWTKYLGRHSNSVYRQQKNQS